MANYNTFVVYDCNKRKLLLVTSSARKANEFLRTGVRIEIWNNNRRIEKIYEFDKRREAQPLSPYIELEKEYIRKKQEVATKRNKQRKCSKR